MNELIQIQHEFIKAFLITLFHSLWIGAFLFILLKALLSGTPFLKSGQRYALATGSLLLFLMMVTGIFISIYKPLDQINSFLPAILAVNDIRELFSTNSAAEISGQKNSISSLLLLFYVAGLFFFTIRLVLSSLKIKKYIRTGYEVGDGIYSMLDQLREKLQIRKLVRIVCSDKISSPALFGFFKPVIIVPSAMFSHLSFEQTEVILMHELLHIKRFDFIVNVFQLLVEISFFFNPFVWLISAVIRHERELRCDDQVLHHSNEPASYAKALFNLSLFSGAGASVSLPARGSSNKQLIYRIKRIINFDTMKTTNRNKAHYSILLLLGIVCILTFSGFSNTLLNIERGKAAFPKANTEDQSMLREEAVEIKENKEIIVASWIPEEHRNEEITIALPDTLTAEQKEEMIASLEKALENLKSIDWEEKLREIQYLQQERLTELPEKIKEEQYRMQQELQKLDEEMIKKEMKIAQQKMDSLREFFDTEELQEEIRAHHEKLEQELITYGITGEELQKHMEDAMRAIEDIDIDSLLIEMELAMKDVDIDFDNVFEYEVDIDMDSLMENIRVEIESLDIEAIKKDIQISIEEIEQKLKQLKEDETEE